MDIFCFIVVIFLQENLPAFAAPEPFYNWPLPPEYPSLETTGNPSVATGSCLGSDVAHPSLDYNSSTFTASSLAYRDFTLDDTAIVDDFAFSVFVSPTADSGTIFHYEKQDLSTGIASIKIIIFSYNMNETNLYIIGDNATDLLLNLTIQHHFQDDQWTPVSINYDQSSREFVIWTGDSSIKQVIDIKRRIGKPGKVRLGGSFLPQYDSYDGRATCFQFYESKLDNSFNDALSHCLFTSWPLWAQGNYTENANRNCDTMKGYYDIVSKGMAPSSTTTPLASLVTSSRVRCADWCDRPGNTCVSFAINRSQKRCYLFDANESGNLVLESNTDYYITRALNNCC